MSQFLSTGIRLIRLRPLFSAAIVATLAIAIGATAAVYGVLDKLLVRPLPFPAPDRVMFVDDAWPLFHQTVNGEPQLSPDAGLASLARYEVGRVSVGVADQHVARVARASGQYFAILGIAPASGTAFGREAVADARHNVVIVSHSLSRGLFADDGNAIGRSLTINGRTYVVSGVMPQTFAFHVRGQPIDAWIPMVEADDLFLSQQMEGHGAIARLKDGFTVGRAQMGLNRVFEGIASARPELRLREDDRPRLVPLREHWFGPLRAPLLMLIGAAGCLLLIAAANVTGLMLARAAARRKDAAIRLVLGATRTELVQESLGESVLLGLLAAGAGLLIADWGAKALLAISPIVIPHADQMGVSIRMVGFALVAGLSSACLSGAIAAWRASRGDPSRGLTSGPRDATFAGTRLRHALVVAQIAITVMLLVNGGLLLRSFQALRFENTGFDPRRVFTIEIAATPPRFADGAARLAYYGRLLDAAGATRGVEHAGMVNFLPMLSGSLVIPVRIPGVAPDESPSWSYRAATADYFRAMRIPVLAGRVFTEGDRQGAPLVAVVDRSAAIMLGGSPDSVIGKRITVRIGESATYEIVGIVGDVRQQGLGIQAYPGFYLSAYQRTPTVVTLVARVGSDPVATGDALRAALRGVDAALPIGSLYLLDARVSDTVSRRRFALVLSGMLGIAALVLTIVALFGLMSQFVVHRLHEIGVRVALGARPVDVLALVLRRGVMLAAIGIAAGLGAALATSRLLAGLLYGVGASDPLTFVTVPALVVIVALMACSAPAVRAVRANPVDALRAE